MDSIVVKVSDLLAKAAELKDANMDFVELSFLEAEPEDELPASVHFEAFSSDDPYCRIDFEDVDEVQV